MSEWWWHLWHDPMRDNPWTWPAMAVALVGLVLLVKGFDRAVASMRRAWQNRGQK